MASATTAGAVVASAGSGAGSGAGGAGSDAGSTGFSAGPNRENFAFSLRNAKAGLFDLRFLRIPEFGLSRLDFATSRPEAARLS